MAVIVVAVLSVVPAASVSASAQPLLLVPAYFSATGTPNPWDTMCGAMNQAGSGSVAILNPDNGPGRKANPDYAAALSYCHLEGQRVIGYVYTKYAKRPIAKVEADIDKYFSFYPTIDGIFLDNMAQVPTGKASCRGCKMTTATYYSTLYSYVHSKAPGMEVIEMCIRDSGCGDDLMAAFGQSEAGQFAESGSGAGDHHGLRHGRHVR